MIKVESKSELKNALKNKEEVIQIVGIFADEVMKDYGSVFRNISQFNPIVGPLPITPLITPPALLIAKIMSIREKLKKYSIEKYEKGTLLTIKRS